MDAGGPSDLHGASVVSTGAVRSAAAPRADCNEGRGAGSYWKSGNLSQYRFIAYTYHGTGAWPDEGKRYSAETHATDLTAFISSLKAGPVHLVGQSYGGMLAAMVGMKEPALIRTLTLAEPGLFRCLPKSRTASRSSTNGTRVRNP